MPPLKQRPPLEPEYQKYLHAKIVRREPLGSYELAAALGISHQTTRAMIIRAMAKFKEACAAHGITPLDIGMEDECQRDSIVFQPKKPSGAKSSRSDSK